MKTTLDLPDDVAHLLRMGSARRGGRKQASLSKLVTDAVRLVYTSPTASPRATIHLQPGRVIVGKAEGAPVVGPEDVARAL